MNRDLAREEIGEELIQGVRNDRLFAGRQVQARRGDSASSIQLWFPNGQKVILIIVQAEDRVGDRPNLDPVSTLDGEGTPRLEP